MKQILSNQRPKPLTRFTLLLIVIVVSATVATRTADAGGEPSCDLTCPGSMTVGTNPGECRATVTYTPPPTPPVCTVPMCTPPPNSFFELGTTTVTCTSRVAGGSTGITGVTQPGECTFEVTVIDDEPPTITGLPLVTVDADLGLCSATVSFSVTASDNCDMSVTPSCTPSSGDAFMVGTTTVECEASDTAGNTTLVFSTVTVNDAESPVIGACPANICMLTGGSGQVVTFTVPTASDNCPGVTTNCSPASGSTFSPGLTTVTCTATDTAGNSASCTFTVEILTPCDAIANIKLVIADAEQNGDIRRQDSKPLFASLNSACDAFNKGNTGSGINKLQAFQNKVRSHLGTSNPALAMQLIDAAQAIIDAVSGP